MKELPEKLTTSYKPQETEDRIYKLWEESGFFTPENRASWAQDSKINTNHGNRFSMVLPPLNVTGTLHMGHAIMLTIEDAVVRFERMRGKKTLWLPGTDHAAIATAAKVEKELYKKEKKTRHDLGREEFLRRVQAFAKENQDSIINQLKKMGSSLDWSREAFTLDDMRAKAVYTAFERMYKAGLIYRGHRVVNWDPKAQTTISDDEIIHEERAAPLYTFRYSKDFPIPIATTRPETKVGDTAVAVHPDGEYKGYIGKEFDVQFAGTMLHLKVVGDETVDPAFGTGALGVTPAHSAADFDMAQKHNLPLIQVINEHARMTKKAGPLVAGQKTKEARETIVNWLKENGLMEKEEETTQNLSLSERTGAVIEPLPKLQWFVDVNKKFEFKARGNGSLLAGLDSKSITLKELMRYVVEHKEDGVVIVPDHFKKNYFHWIDNLRDWCISRQIWYGHQIPVWYHDPVCIPRPDKEEEVGKCKDIVVSYSEPKCEYCDAAFHQDPDTLDTWFSSGLWTFSTLGWPEETEDLRTYHPTDLLETGYDILFFWVARMILMSGFLLGSIPFRTVYLHGLVRDEKGRKMSKSLGNVIDPLDMIQKYGADATRMALIVGNAPGQDLKLREDKIKGYKHFTNKVWNITRFVLASTGGTSKEKEPTLTESDKKLLETFHDEARTITKWLEKPETLKLHLASEKIYHYIWHTFADTILEESKAILAGNDNAEKQSRERILLHIWTESIKLLHPFMPFVTEEIWSLMREVDALPENETELLMVSKWPM